MRLSKSTAVVCSNGRDFMCNRCGAIHSVSLPMHISKYAKVADAFSALHRNCTPIAQAKCEIEAE